MRAPLLIAALAGAALANRALVGRETKPAEADGGRVVEGLHVLEEGELDAPAVVLLHGLAGSLRWFDRLAPLLAREARVVRIDLLGHGGSEKPRSGYAIEEQARRVAAALDRLGVAPELVVGHSMGGAVTTALAEARPELVPRLVVLDEGPDNSFGSFSLLARLGFTPVIGELLHRLVPDRLVRDGYRDAFADGFELTAGFPDPDQVVRDFRRMTYTSYRESHHAEDRYLAAERLDARLERLGVPALVVFGEDDAFFRARDSAEAFRRLSGVRTMVLPGVGHSPSVERPEELAELVTERLFVTPL